MNRGSAAVGGSLAKHPPGFNEAPIHESGKRSRLATERIAPPSGFNEAPIHESGKQGWTGIARRG